MRKEMTKMGFSANYRNTIIADIAELLAGSKKGNRDVARELVIDLAIKSPKSRSIPNRHLTEIFRQAAVGYGIRIGILRRLVERFEIPPKTMRKQKSSRRKIAAHRKRKTRQSKPLDRETTLRYLQNALDKNFAMGRKAGLDIKRYQAEKFMDGVKFQLAKKPYTNREVVNAARSLNRKEMIVTPISVSNAIIDMLSRRANLKITIISTPTRR